MNKCAPRVVGTLVGNIKSDQGAQVKYGCFFEALSHCFPVVDIYDASLQGVERFFNALRTFHPDMRQWRERFHKNVGAFRLRSRRAARYFGTLEGRADVILQVGVLFNARWDADALPSVIYSDYTAHLSAQIPAAGRSPFTSRQRQEWLALERAAFVRASHICARSELVRNSLIEDYQIAPERVTVVGGGINFPELPKLTTRRFTEKPTVLFVGKELYRKGGDILLEAFAEARKKVPLAHLLFLTQGPIPDTLPLNGVEIIKPTWERNTIVDLYRRADLLVLPSRLETWGDVLLEAMSYGLPCIGVAGQAMEEIIEHEQTGLIVAPENAPALAEALVRLLSDESLRWRLGRAGRLRAETEYGWDRVVDRLACVIESAAASKKGK